MQRKICSSFYALPRFVSQLSFIQNSTYLCSAGADCYLRCWQSRTGRELGAFKLEFPTINGLSLEDDSKESSCRVIVSRLFMIKPNICVGACASHPVVFTIPVHISTDGSSAEWGPICVTTTPGDCPLVDCVVCPLSVPPGDQLPVCMIGLTGEVPSRLVAWNLSLRGSADSQCQFEEVRRLRL
ncbi:unnamed protein product [Echinostoma caproni]|uniref:WD_REPEATS_REGION domain-containing protein n=1 Tax=Echinostoma caproni TaxID=27848 RepID=A0A183B159_9TREM|nr:unnamed protein product [Echinostoma caproni]